MHVADARDGHARLEYDAATVGALPKAQQLPLRVQLEGDRVFILYNDTPADSVIRPGMELLSINGRSTQAIVREILPKVSGDGFIETGKRVRLARSFAQLYWLFVDSAAAFDITARTATGGVVTARLSGVQNAERSSNANPVNAVMRKNIAQLDAPVTNISLSFPEAGVARLRVRAFDGATFAVEVDSVLRKAGENQMRALILDLRGNGGGVDEYGAFLVSRFLSQPFRYFDRIHLTSIRPTFATWKATTFENLRTGTLPDPNGGFLVQSVLHPGVAIQQPAAQPFLGPLVVLMDGGSFSTAADVTAQLRSHKRAVFVGEETAGAYEGNTSGLNASVVLPNSRLSLKIMMYDYWNAVTAPAKPGRGTIPDVEVLRKAGEMLAGVDAPLERAVRLARERIAKP